MLGDDLPAASTPHSFAPGDAVPSTPTRTNFPQSNLDDRSVPMNADWVDENVDLFFDGDDMDDGDLDDGLMQSLDNPEPGDDAMISALVLAGATLKQAQQYTLAVRGQPDTPTFMEFFGRGSVVKQANKTRRSLNIKGLHALDLRTLRSDGTH